MNKIVFRIAFIWMLLSAQVVLAESAAIHTINSMQEIKQYIDKDTLILLDLDHTVFEAKNYGYGHANWFYDRIEKAKGLGVDEATTIRKIFPHWLHSQKTAQVKPVEAITPALIKQLKAEGYFVMGLTSRQVPLVDITIDQLKTIGIDFRSKRLPIEVISMDFSAPTQMKAGILFCSEYNNKGDVLHAYLDKLKIAPKKVLIVDDSMRNIKSVIHSYSPQAVVTGLYYPLVADYKKQHWDPEHAHKAYYQVYLNNVDLQNFPLEEK
jgi:hypothetical protein